MVRLVRMYCSGLELLVYWKEGVSGLWRCNEQVWRRGVGKQIQAQYWYIEHLYIWSFIQSTIMSSENADSSAEIVKLHLKPLQLCLHRVVMTSSGYLTYIPKWQHHRMVGCFLYYLLLSNFHVFFYYLFLIFSDLNHFLILLLSRLLRMQKNVCKSV